MITHSKPCLDQSDFDAVEQVLRSGMLETGSVNDRFESVIAEFCQSKFALSQKSGTSALTLALLSLDLPDGGEVVVPSYVCGNVARAVRCAGLEPVIADVGVNGLLSKETVASRLGPRSVAIIAVHLFGQPCDVTGLSELGLPVLEDACQALGLDIDGQPAGSIGAVGVLSFHATKMITSGQGGMMVTSSPVIAERALDLVHGCGPFVGIPFAQLSDLEAALGLSQFAKLPSFLDRRASIALQYEDALSLVEKSRFGATSNCSFRFLVEHEREFEDFQRWFARFGVSVRRGVDALVHRTEGGDASRFSRSEQLYRQLGSIPIYPALTDQEIDSICTAITDYFGNF